MADKYDKWRPDPDIAEQWMDTLVAFERKTGKRGQGNRLVNEIVRAYLSSPAETLQTSAPVPTQPVQNQHPVPKPEQTTRLTAHCDSLSGSEFSPEVGTWVNKLVRVLNAPQFAHAIQQNLDSFVLGIEAMERLADLEQRYDGASRSDAGEADSLQAGIAGLSERLKRASGLLEGTGAAPQGIRRKAK